jgi:phosphonate transport system permease protein
MRNGIRQTDLKPVVSPLLAGILSLIIPGLGQTVARFRQRGFLIFAAVLSMSLIMNWRIAELGRRAGTGWSSFMRALERRPFFVIVVLFCIAAIWLLNAWDAWLCARDRRRRFTGMFIFILLGFFIQGWQIAQIDPVKLIREAPEALPPLMRVMWPWKAAVTYDTDNVVATAKILAYQEEEKMPAEAPVPPPLKPGEPYLRSIPNIGRMSTRDTNNNLVEGTRIVLEGENFEPDTATEIWWTDPLGNTYRPREGGEYMIVDTDSEGSFRIEMTMPYQLIPPSAEGEAFEHTIEARQVFRIGPPKASDALRMTIARMMETIFMGMMATAFGIVLAIPISFLAARNIMAGSRLTIAFYYLTRTILNIIRSIEPLIWALIAVVWVGLGPFAGIVALTLHSIAALGKLYSEAIESIDPGPIEAIEATGATRLQVILFGVIPQMISPFISFSIYRWDINVRMSTVIGLVGGGGIGFLLVQYIRLLDYRSAGIAVWFIAVTVAILDYVSAEIRNKLM